MRYRQGAEQVFFLLQKAILLKTEGGGASTGPMKLFSDLPQLSVSFIVPDGRRAFVQKKQMYLRLHYKSTQNTDSFWDHKMKPLQYSKIKMDFCTLIWTFYVYFNKMQFPAFKSKGTAKLPILNYCHEMKIKTKKGF